VRDSAALNTRILKLDLADLYAQQGRASANGYADQARQAQAVLVRDTATFNALHDGKWRDMMDMAPRRLPVFEEPLWPHWSDSAKDGCDLALSGQWINDHNTLTFVSGRAQMRPITLYGYRAQPQAWRLDTPQPGFNLSTPSGELNGGNGFEQRLSLAYDGTATPGDREIGLTCGGNKLTLYVSVLPSLPGGMAGEDNRIVSLAAAQTGSSPDWQVVDGLGSLGRALRARLDLPVRSPDALNATTPAIYPFATSTEVGGQLKVVALPTHPLDPGKGVRVAVALDGGPLQVLDFSTAGRSDVWRGNVLTNTAIQAVPFKSLAAGKHELKVYPLDPGVVLDRIEIDLDRAPAHYGAVPPQEPGS
jgi:hypothetical protein